LQERIGYVNKGLNLDRIRSFPQMKKSELQKFLKNEAKSKRQQERAAAGFEEIEASENNAEEAVQSRGAARQSNQR
tara:strand:- start:326 stop:553 length:228 start_codon:yes stop_codon:yes gene_type:complete